MNVFEMFGFFMIGSFFNMIIIVIFLLIVINKVKNSISENVKTIVNELNGLVSNANGVVKILKGGKNVKSEEM